MTTAQSDGAVFIAHDERVAAHSSRWPHIEKADRALAAAAHLRDCGLLARCIELRGRAATDEELLSVHSQAHLDEVARLSRAARDEPANRSLLEPDGAGGVYYSAQADTAARLATGSVIEAVEAVLTARPEPKPDDAQRQLGALTARIEPTASEDAERRLGARAVGFALVRPPGHHAGADDAEGHRAEGFCFFNSVAVAAAVARRHVERVFDSRLGRAPWEWDAAALLRPIGCTHHFFTQARTLANPPCPERFLDAASSGTERALKNEECDHDPEDHPSHHPEYEPIAVIITRTITQTITQTIHRDHRPNSVGGTTATNGATLRRTAQTPSQERCARLVPTEVWGLT